MKILLLSDWHGTDYPLPNEPIDCLIVLGDFNWQQVKQLDEHYTCTKIGLLGNHDVWDTYKNTNFIHLHKKVIDVNGFKIAGFDGSPRYSYKDTPQFEEEEVAEFTNHVGKVDLFVAHSNPMLTPNFNPTDAHRGFISFTNYIYKEKPTYFAHGHLHIEEQKREGETKLLSVYPSCIIELDNKNEL